ncbi:hypothetical protein [Streptomyces asiaticus]|uniref:hypothetical protein n=1 Tax=Streptomyces asiaticus TaxID=114695 RepID=UPI00381C77B0
MTSDYTELTKEAKSLGGPDALRSHYTRKGRAEAAAIGIALLGAGAGAKWLVEKAHARVARSRTERAVSDSEQESAVEATGDDAKEGAGNGIQTGSATACAEAATKNAPTD